MTGPDPAEPEAVRRKRLRLRAWRRGTREMDLILGRYADAALGGLDMTGLDRFEALLAREDPEIMDWVTGRVAPPDALAAMVAELGRHAANPAGGI